MKWRRIAGCVVVLSATAWGQIAPRPAFEVASLKSSRSTEPGWMLRVLPGGHLKGERITLQQMITAAWDLQKHQVVSAVPWAATERYDLDANAGHPAGEPELRLMMQTLIEDRFHLKVHRETREMGIYSLVLGRNGVENAPAIHPAPDGDCGKIIRPDQAPADRTPCGGESVNAGKITGHSTNMSELATNLAMMVDTSVVNRTGLEGSYDLTLTWTPDQARTPDDTGPSLFTALHEQLGLKLEAGKGPVEILVIDSAERAAVN